MKAVLELLDGYELPASAWEPEVLALRVKNYAPAWLDQLCLHRLDWLGTPDFAANRQRPSRDTGALQSDFRFHAGESSPLAGALRRSRIS